MLYNMLHKKMLWFGAIGIINTSVDWVTFWFLGMMLPNTLFAVWAAKAASYFVGVTCSYLLNTRITFREETQTLSITELRVHSKLFGRFLVVSLLCLALNSSVYLFLAGTQYMAIAPLLAATFVSYVVGFLINYVWTFRVTASR